MVKKRISNVGIMFISLVVSLVLAEGITRVMDRNLATVLDVREYDSMSGSTLKNNLEVFSMTDYRQEVHTNSFGSINYQEDFKGYDKLIFAMGDSYTQGIGLSIDAAYPFQLDMVLNMRDGFYHKNYGVLNLGINGSGMKQAILRLKQYASLARNPDYVLFVGCDNDYVDERFFSSEFYKTIPFSNNHKSSVLLRWIVDKSVLARNLYLIYLTKRRDNITAGLDVEGVASLQEPYFDELVSVSKEMNAQLIVTWSVNSNSYNWLKMWASNNGVLFADWKPKVDSVVNAIPEIPIENNHSKGHYRTWVNSLIAKSFAEKIK